MPLRLLPFSPESSLRSLPGNATALSLAALTTLWSCTPTKGEPLPTAPAPLPIAAASAVRSEPIAVANTTNASIDADGEDEDDRDAVNAADDEGDGWAVKAAPGWGVESIPRAEALARVKASPLHVVVTAGASFEECTGMGGTHVKFVVPKSRAAKPFEAAVFGEHGAMLHGVFPPKHLYVAGVRRAPVKHHQGSGVCIDGLGMTDAVILAIVPIRSKAEGRRLLEKLR